MSQVVLLSRVTCVSLCIFILSREREIEREREREREGGRGREGGRERERERLREILWRPLMITYIHTYIVCTRSNYVR